MIMPQPASATKGLSNGVNIQEHPFFFFIMPEHYRLKAATREPFPQLLTTINHS